MPKKSKLSNFLLGEHVCDKTTDYIDQCYHKQVRVSGVNSRTKEKFDLYCDEDIAYPIARLNELGIHTCYSCQGGCPVGDTGYICFLPASHTYMAMAYALITDWFKDYWLKLELDGMGRIVVRFYRQRPRYDQIISKGGF